MCFEYINPLDFETEEHLPKNAYLMTSVIMVRTD